MKKNFFLIIIAFTIFSCKDEESQQTENTVVFSERAARISNSPNLLFLSFPKSWDTKRDAIELLKFKKESGIIDISMKENDWQQSDKKLQSLLKKYVNHKYYFVLAQTAGQLMFRKHNLLQYDATDKKLTKTISFYLETLNNGGSIDTEIIYSGLVKLNGHWSKPKIQKIAKETVNRVTDLESYDSRFNAPPQISSLANGEKNGFNAFKENLMTYRDKLRDMAN